MKKIKLTRDMEAIVDDADYKWLSKYNWHVTPLGPNKDRWVAQRTGRNGERKGNYAMHREIMGLKIGDGVIVDHINRNTLDNRRDNLRIVTPSQSVCNRGPNKGKKYKGVFWREDFQRYIAEIKINRKKIFIGQFKNELDAVRAYNKKAKEIHGDYAYINPV